MSNNANIKGNKNFIFQGNRNSKIRMQQRSPSKQRYTLWGTIIAILGLIVTIIASWDKITKFLGK